MFTSLYHFKFKSKSSPIDKSPRAYAAGTGLPHLKLCSLGYET